MCYCVVRAEKDKQFKHLFGSETGPPHQSLYRIGSRICFIISFMPIYRMVQNVIPYVLACICCKASCEATPCVCATPSRNA